MLSVERIRALCAVAEQGSVAAAARSLYVTPSGVSQQLAKLEKEVGVALLVQVGRGVQLTQAGRLLAQRGQDIISLLAQAESEVASLDSDVAGELRIGSFSSASRVVVPRAIARMRQLHPGLEVSFVAGDTDDLLPAVVGRELDLAVVDSWVTMPLHLPEDVICTPIHQDVADVALPADHRLAAAEQIELDEVADMPWTTWRKGESFHTWLVQTLRMRGVEPEIRYEVPEFAAQLEFVAHGLAAALIPRLARIWVPDDVAIVAVHPVLRREIFAVRRKDNDRPTVRAGIDALSEVFAAISGSGGPT
ncbi:transcriptional regulator, LysR family protein (plasmid) [Rhodococcus jostii RHA1]|uniref:Transcriptional regulator, LysR family protein n=1 Tax=Rhodococcus jostii (strain RHA1) TaxID=101510 RepID=Q0RY04_RHOJR|nr:LysR family transcriptional regulator [Rhodococcus jostii]ABG99832.1 transcriptional regulator, LysR family protein [Rhodococcus jostii RHA1]